MRSNGAVIAQHTGLAPSLGRDAELRRLVADEVRRQQAAGRPVTLGQRILGGMGTVFVVTAVAADVAELDATRRALDADAAFQAYLARASGLARQPAWTVVAESILTAPPGLAGRSTVTETTVVAPVLGEETRAAAILDELARSAQAAGIASELWRQIYAPDGPTLLAVSHYADVAELDGARRARYPIVQQAMAALGGLTRAPTSVYLTETLVPLPGRGGAAMIEEPTGAVP